MLSAPEALVCVQLCSVELEDFFALVLIFSFSSNWSWESSKIFCFPLDKWGILIFENGGAVGWIQVRSPLLLGCSHESQTVKYLRFLPQTEITFGKYRAMTVDKYEYCRRVWKICIAREELEPIAADCPEFIAAIQFNRRLQFSRLLHLLGQWDQAEVLRVKYPTANSDKIALRRKNARRSHTR